MKKEGADPRFVGDSSISHANLLCRVCEKVELPSLSDVAEFATQHRDHAWTAFSLDVVAACRHSDVPLGWKVLEASNQAMLCARDLLCAKVRNGRIWVKFPDSCASGKIALNTCEAGVASFSRDVIKADVPVQWATGPGLPGAAAEDAFAEGDRAGLVGGGLSLVMTCALTTLTTLPSSSGNLTCLLGSSSRWGRSNARLQPMIAVVEALAQLVQRPCSMGWLATRQSCDNLGVVGAGTKGLSLSDPLASVLQSAGSFCATHRIDLRLTPYCWSPQGVG